MSNQLQREWQLLNTGTGGGIAGVDLNVVPAWADATGKGVTVAVIDDAVQVANPAFAGRVSAASLDTVTNAADPSGVPANRHGTNVAGVALAGNDYGGPVGVAYDATLLAIRIPFGAAPDATGEPNSTPADAPADVRAINRAWQSGADVLNNSWGIPAFASNNLNQPSTQALVAAIHNAVAQGRGGLGASVVFASGNDGAEGSDVSFDQVNADPEVITVGAIANNGLLAGFSTKGAGVLVVAPGDSIVTTERSDGPDPNGDGTVSTLGTSFAAPGVSGVVALMLQANPRLGWRDVQEILADTARVQNGETSLNAATQFDTTTGNDWNGGGRHFSSVYGFGYGLVDAAAAVRLAATWTRQSTSANQATATGTADLTAAPGAVTPGASYSSTLTIGQALRVETVQVSFAATNLNVGDLVVQLVAPDGTKSLLMARPGTVAVPGSGTARVAVSTATLTGETVTSRGFLGAQGQGTWTLNIFDAATGQAGTLAGWGLNLIGDAEGTSGFGTPMVLTDEFARYAAADPARQAMTASATVTSVNAAAVTGAARIDLTGGASSIDGVAATFTGFHSAVGGAGATTLIGTALADTLVGGEGSTTMVGGGGEDSFTTGKGASQVFAGAGTSTVLSNGTDTVAATSGTVNVFGRGASVQLAGAAAQVMFVAGAGAATVNGGAGSVTVFGGAGAGVYGGGSAGNNVIVGGTGRDVLIGGGTGDVLFAGGAAGQLVSAGAGNETLSGANSTGSNTFAGGGRGTNDLIGAGVGNDTVLAGAGTATVFGGAGADLFAFSAARGGGTAFIMDFNAAQGDRVTLQGYGAGELDAALARTASNAAGTVMQLSDGTNIAFFGMQGISRAMFV